MNAAAHLRLLQTFPEPEFEALKAAAFADYGDPSRALAEVLADEAKARGSTLGTDGAANALRLGAFIDDRLVGWSYSESDGRQLHTINSGVHPDFRGRGIYSQLIQGTIAYATEHAFMRVLSRHVPDNNRVIIPKLRAGFFISAFEYSEVYGPVVHLTYLVNSTRRELHRRRSRPIVPKTSD